MAMALFAQYALPGIIVLSALGAIIMCLLVVRYGLVPDVDGDEDLEEVEHRQVVTRLGYAAAAACFACVAILAVIAMAARTAPPVSAGAQAAAPRASDAPEGDGQAGLTQEIRRVEERLSKELSSLEERVTATEETMREAQSKAAGTVDLPPRTVASATASGPASPPRDAAAKSAAESEPAKRRAPDEAAAAVAALPADLGEPQMTATVQGVRVDVLTTRGGRRDTVYTVKLLEAGRRPLSGAEVTLLGHSDTGASLMAPLTPGSEPGIYRGRVPASPETLRDFRLRVSHRAKRFEVSLSQGVTW
jgi:hypothetical protein